MLKVLKTLKNNHGQDDRYLSNFEVSQPFSPSYSDSKSFISLSTEESRPCKQAPNQDENDQSGVKDAEDKFDFETFHKNMNKQKAKSAQVRSLV